MPDMLVNLLSLPDDSDDLKALNDAGIKIRRIQPYEISVLRRFVMESFGEGWADEVMNSFTHQPVSCYVATQDKKIVGFGAYECTRRDFFGPTGVKPSHRGKGVGKALLLACLRGLYEMGYAYAIIGGAGPTDFYAKCVGAIALPNSMPNVYEDSLDEG